MTAETSAASNAQGLRVIGAGFGRTGTLSMKTVLEELGFAPCYHMVEVFQHPEAVPYWEAAVEGNFVDWHAIFGKYQATVDWPGCTFYEQLMQVYPDAKVLLNVRDFDSWYESVLSTIYPASRNRPTPEMLSMFDAEHVRWGKTINTLIWQKTFHNRFDDKTYARSVFEQHYEEVKRKVPAERLLIYSVKEGWEPLCAFLNVEVPQNTPFPRLNDRESFMNRTGIEQQRTE